MPSDTLKNANALIHETSPYLLQHAYNPVDWHAWNEEALEKAKREDKLLIISIGYSACHWCHVMEHESFEDSLVAELMNENFLPIKVDREERPDVDDVYMTACNLVNGSGGWPLNAVALPDGSPIWAGTYFPKEQWVNILKQFKELKESNYGKLEESAKKLLSGLQQVDAVVDVPSEVEFTSSEVEKIGDRFITNIDLKKGGLKSVQKFPLPSNYKFLLKYAYKFPESQALEAVKASLNAMVRGGIYDQVEGGWARYTVDDKWMVPHFEKMLYDNGQLVELYSQAYKMTKNAHYERVVRESLAFMKERWRDEAGGYYSSYDADSEGKEGKFYVWTYEELQKLIPEEDFYDFTEYYNIEEDGNWEEKNILHVDRQAEQEDEEMLKRRKKWNSILKKERSQRTFPGLDDKILCSWNAILLSGLVEAHEALGDEEYKEEAISIWNFIENELLQDDMRLNRNYKEGRATINAFLDDYALVIKALTDLYQITFEEEYLLKADKIMAYVVKHFRADKSAMFNYTSDLDPPLVARKLELTDGVIPSSNSVMARNLYTLGLFLYKKEYVASATQMMRNMKNSVLETKQPNFYANWCNLYFDMIYDPYEVAILGPGASQLRQEMMREYHPNALYLGGESEGSLQLLKDKLQEGENFVYVCVNKMCKLPVQNAAKALELLD